MSRRSESRIQRSSQNIRMNFHVVNEALMLKYKQGLNDSSTQPQLTFSQNTLLLSADD